MSKIRHWFRRPHFSSLSLFVGACILIVIVGVVLSSFHLLPGIPRAGTSDAIAFSVSFWAALYSGILYSIFTGLVVGLVIWLVQESAEVRRVQRGYEREVALLQERIFPLLTTPNPTIVGTAIESEPRPVKAVIDLLQNQPIELWRANLPLPHKFLDTVRELQKAHNNFVIAAERLDLWLRQVIRLSHNARNIASFNDMSAHQFSVGRIQDVPAEDAARWVDLDAAAELPGLEESYVDACSRAQQQISQYLEAKQSILACFKEVARSLE